MIRPGEVRILPTSDRTTATDWPRHLTSVLGTGHVAVTGTTGAGPDRPNEGPASATRPLARLERRIPVEHGVWDMHVSHKPDPSEIGGGAADRSVDRFSRKAASPIDPPRPVRQAVAVRAAQSTRLEEEAPEASVKSRPQARGRNRPTDNQSYAHNAPPHQTAARHHQRTNSSVKRRSLAPRGARSRPVGWGWGLVFGSGYSLPSLAASSLHVRPVVVALSPRVRAGEFRCRVRRRAGPTCLNVLALVLELSINIDRRTYCTDPNTHRHRSPSTDAVAAGGRPDLDRTTPSGSSYPLLGFGCWEI